MTVSWVEVDRLCRSALRHALVKSQRNMRHFLLITTAVGACAVGAVVFAVGTQGPTPGQAVARAAPAVASLGFDPAMLGPPKVSGSTVWGTRSFYWDIVGRAGEVNRLTYLVADERLCWSSNKSSTFVDHGCVVVKESA